MNKKVTLLIIFITIVGIISFNLISFDEYELTEDERELVEYFNEIALKSEFDDSPEKIKKWTKPMKLYILKDKEYKKQVLYIKNTIETINNLAQDNFKIELVDDLMQGNSVLFLLEKEKVMELDSLFFDGINEDFVGLTQADYNGRFEIYSAKIFIDITEPIESQKSIILEEITHSLGLLNDSEKDPNSIFYEKQYENDNLIFEYSINDVELIKLLYHPDIKSGLNKNQVEKTIKRIFKQRK